MMAHGHRSFKTAIGFMECPGQCNLHSIVQLLVCPKGIPDWKPTTVLLNDKTGCNTIASGFFAQMRMRETANPLSDGHRCQHKGHLGRVRIFLSDGGPSESVPFCILDDNDNAAVVPGHQTCLSRDSQETRSAALAAERETDG